MAHDAIDGSLSEGDSVLSDYVVAQAKRLRAVEDALAHLRERAERAEARAASAEALAEANASRLAAVSRAEAIIARAAAAGPRHAGRPKRDRHGLYLVPTVPVAVIATTTAWAALRAAGAWAMRTSARKAVTVAATAAVAGGVVVAAPDMTQPGHPLPAAVRPVPLAPVRLPRHHHHAAPAGLVPPVIAHRRRRVHHSQAVPEPDPEPTPSPSASPSPSITPSPGPSITPSAGAAAITRRVLRDLSGLINQGVPSRTSAVLKPGPRLLAGSTVTVKQAATRARRVASGRAANASAVILA